MFTVTFYSFKGGVGRTLSLMNTAYRLSSQGKRVFILDFDLEAPGVDVFSSPSQQERGGLLDYIGQYSETGSVPPLEQYVSRMSWQNGEAVFYMSAGRRDQNYQSLLAKLNWKDFYTRHRGFYFVENLKGAIDAIYHPDYVLVDSRTGLTDISGICTLQLPDLVVLLFGLNDQNLIGTSQIYRSITHNTLNRSIQTLLVASPVPDIPEFVGIKKQRIERARTLLGKEPDIVLPFNAFVAFKETIIPAEMGEFLNQAYDNLYKKIISCNSSDIWTLLRSAEGTKEAGDLEQAQTAYEQIVKTNPSSPDAWIAYGSFRRSINKHSDALSAYLSAEGAGAGSSIYGDIAVTYLYLRNFDSAGKYLARYLSSDIEPDAAIEIARAFAYRDQADQAIQIYEKIANSGKARPEVVSNSLFEIGGLYLRLDLPAKALVPYQTYVSRSPIELPSVYNMGVALARLGRISEALPWFQRAIALFERTTPPKGLPIGRANTLQAISQAYAASGDYVRAIALVKESIALAETFDAPVFSSIQYRYIPKPAFVEESRGLLRKFIDRSERPAASFMA